MPIPYTLYRLCRLCLVGSDLPASQVGVGEVGLSEVMVLGRWWRGRAFGREEPKEPTAARKEPTGPFLLRFLTVYRKTTNPARFFLKTSLLGAPNEV